MEDNNGMRIVGYNTQTGEPIWAPVEAAPAAEPTQRTIVGYNTFTGEPIYEDAQAGVPVEQCGTTAPPSQIPEPIFDEDAPSGGGVGGGGSGDGSGTDDGSKRSIKDRISSLVGKWWLIGAIAGGVVLTAVIVLLCVFCPPRSVVTRAAAKTAKQFVEVGSRLADASGFSKVAVPLLKKDFGVDLELEIDEMPDSAYAEEAEGSNLIAQVNYDKSHKQTGIDLEVGVGGMASIRAELYGDEECVMAAAPDIFDDPLRVETEDIFGQLVDAELVPEELSDVEFDLNLFPDGKGELAPKQILKRYMDYSGKTLKQALKDIEIERDGSDRREAFGKNSNCAKYVVTVPAKAVLRVAGSVRDFLSRDKAILNVLDPFYNFSRGQYVEDMLDDWYERLEDSWEEDMVFDVYIKKGSIVCVEGYAEDEDNEYEIELLLTGRKKACEEIKLEFVSNDTTTFEWSYSNELSGKTLDIRSKTESWNGTTEQKISYDTDSGELVVKAEMSDVEVKLKALAGTYKGAFNVSDMELTVDADGETLKLIGMCSIHEVDDVEEPDGSPEDILEMSAQERRELLNAIYQSGSELLN